VNNGDSIMVQAFKFSEVSAAAVTEEYIRLESARSINRIIGWVAALLMLGLLALLVRSVVTTAFPKEFALPRVSEAGRAVELTEEEEYALKRLDEVSATHQEKMRKEIGRLIKTQPDQVVSLLRTWMLEDT
jgi:flagellar biosynthesis/type III secretory pathway M-ring protein FliF/YscJ